MNNFPDVICTGFMKCATTVLAHNIQKHPDIKLIKNPNDKKISSTEIRFWNNKSLYNTFKKDGIEWYKSLFKYNDKIQFEKCANYCEDKSAMERISKYIPNVKLILCIREPVSRMYSEFQMQIPNQKFTIDLAKKRGYLNRSKYYNMIENNILPFFPKENLYFIIQERMKNSTSNEMNKLFKFLNVKELNYDFYKVSSQEAINRNLDLNKDSEIKSFKVWNTKYNKQINKNIKNQLKDYFIEHNEKLFEFLNYRINEWG